MRAARLDRRVRKEAKLLVREARAALDLKRGLRGKAGDLEAATTEVEQGLGDSDLQRVRRGLPTLDALVDELIKRPPKSTTRDYVESIGLAVLIALALRAFVIEAFKIPSSSMYPTLEIGDHIFVNKFIYGIRIPWTNTKLFELRGPHHGEVIVFAQPCETDRDYIKRVIALAGETVEVRCNVVYVNGKPIPNKLVQEQCKHDDFEEPPDDGKPGKGPAGDGWFERSCSKYEETVEGMAYFTYHDPERPTRDRGPVSSRPNTKDFPDEIPRHCANQIDDDPHDVPNQKPGKIVVTRNQIAPGTECEPYRHYVVPEGHVFVMGDNRANSNDSRYWGSVPIENIKGKALFIWLSYKRWGFDSWGEIRWRRMGNFVH
ncbi:MAG TPA: signal peptidase I [Kofleriaceae bacterium]|nr:signal peptidase I [Kofleriaceae bacterium]